MGTHPFEVKVGTAVARLRELEGRVAESPPPQRSVLAELVEQLHAALEEAQVSAEELRQQNEEILTTRTEMDAQRRRYQDLFDFAPDGYLVTDTQGVIREANLAIGAMLGRYREKLVGKPLAACVAEECRREFRMGLLPLASGKDPCVKDWELRLLRGKDESFPAAVDACGMADADGHVSGLRWLIRDISERKRAERSAREQQQMSQLIMDMLPHPAMLIGPDRVILAANRLAREAGAVPGEYCWNSFGQSRFVTGQAGRDTGAEAEASPRDVHCWFCRAAEAVKGTQPVRAEIESFGRVWETHWIPLAEGAYLRCSVDITERKLVEAALRHDREQLSSQVQEQTADLSKTWQQLQQEVEERQKVEQAKEQMERQLAQAQKMEAVGRLAGGIAHDFNNLLTVFSLYAARLRAERIDPDQLREVTEGLGNACEKGTRLVDQLLAFSRRQILRPAPLDLNAVVSEMVSMLSSLVSENIDMSLDLAPNPGPVLADHAQLQQVIMNLVLNARDAMPDGGGLSIRTSETCLGEKTSEEQRAEPGRYVLLTVADTGCGMDEATRQRIFEPFFTTKAEGTGTGLGLATVYGIVQQSGGDIRVYSAPGRGTTFKIYLPRAEAAPAQSGRKAEAARPASVAAKGKGETILLVEDEAHLRTLARLELEDRGYRVLEAGNVGQALAVAEEHGKQVDLLVTDVILPGLNGMRLCQIMNRRWPGVKVLYMSGYTDRHIVHQGVLDRDVEFLKKPYTGEELVAKVRSVLDSPPAGGTGTSAPPPGRMEAGEMAAGGPDAVSAVAEEAPDGPDDGGKNGGKG